MRLKKFGAVLIAAMAMGAVVASTALATPTESGGHWLVNGSTLSGSQSVSCERQAGSESITLHGTIAGLKVTLTASGVECVESSIFNEGGFAKDKGKLRFTGVKVMEPAGCTTTSTLTTKELNTQLYMEGTKVWDKFSPASGATGTFISIPIEGCAAEGSFPVKGFVYGLASNATGVEEATQTLTFNETTNTESGSALTLGGNAAQITAVAVNKLTAGGNFGAHE